MRGHDLQIAYGLNKKRITLLQNMRAYDASHGSA